MEQDFGIGVGCEFTAFGHQLSAQLFKVINLAVIGNLQPDVAALISQRHRLGAALTDINNRQTAMGQADAPIIRKPKSRPIRSTRDHGFPHPEKLSLIDRRRLIAITENRG